MVPPMAEKWTGEPRMMPSASFITLDPFVDRIISLYAPFVSFLGALAAGQAAANCLVADMIGLGGNALFLELGSHHLNGVPGVAVLVRASIECCYFHACALLRVRKNNGSFILRIITA